VSQAPLEVPVEALRALLGEATAVMGEEERGVALELFGRAQAYHPLDQGHASWLKRGALVGHLDALAPLDRPGDVYRAALSDQDEKLLRDVANAQVAAVASALRERRPAQCAAALASLERLSVVGLRVVDVLVAGGVALVRAHSERVFREGQQCLLHAHFADARAVAEAVRALEAALRRGGAEAGSVLAADLARSLSLRVADLERLVAHREAESERFAQTERDQKAQGELAFELKAMLAKVEQLYRGLASELASVQNELLQAREAAKTMARQLEAAFLEKIRAVEQRAARGDQAEKATAEAAALRAEMTSALAALHEEAAAREAEIQRAIAEQEALAEAKAAEEGLLRRDLESAEAARRPESLDAASAREEAAPVTAGQQQAQRDCVESASAVRAEGEARLRELAAEHAAHPGALDATSAAADAAREANVARALQSGSSFGAAAAGGSSFGAPAAAAGSFTFLVFSQLRAFAAAATTAKATAASAAAAATARASAASTAAAVTATTATAAAAAVAAALAAVAAPTTIVASQQPPQSVT
jgi:hypothetical protein